MRKSILTLLLLTTFICKINGLGFGEEKPKDYTVYETQNKYGTYAGKQREIALRTGIKPVVDVLSEEQKYGNDGGFVRRIGEGILRGTEGVSAKLGGAFEFSKNTQKYFLDGLTLKLNNLGHKVVGLK